LAVAAAVEQKDLEREQGVPVLLMQQSDHVESGASRADLGLFGIADHQKFEAAGQLPVG